MPSFDILVVGGGPAGMIAAGRAGEKGARVLLLEKNKRVGKKLLLTGKGRCNLTNAQPDLHRFVDEFGKRGDFLYSPFSRFGPRETMDFFKKRGVGLKVERGDRVFPQSDKAQEVVASLKKYLKENKVEVKTGCEVKGLDKEQDEIVSARTNKGALKAPLFILATGGKSYPETGSTGQGFKWLNSLGHTITPLRPSLVPLVCSQEWVKDLQGLDLKNVGLTLYLEGKEKEEFFGDMIFTHFGVSGPIVLEASRRVTDLLGKGRVEISLDLKPALHFKKLDKRLVRDFKKYHRSFFKNSLNDLLPSKIIPVVVKESGIPPVKPVHSITRKERHGLVRLLKELKLTVVDTLGFNQAVVTRGGVLTDEVSQKTMRSKLIKNLYLAGEILDLDGPTGGYNLQVAWSTGYVAGESAALGLKPDRLSQPVE